MTGLEVGCAAKLCSTAEREGIKKIIRNFSEIHVLSGIANFCRFLIISFSIYVSLVSLLTC